MDAVDQFVDEVAHELDRLNGECADLRHDLELAKVRLAEFEAQRRTINDTLVSAQVAADQMVKRAGDEAAAILRDSELKAKELIRGALLERNAAQASTTNSASKTPAASQSENAESKAPLGGWREQRTDEGKSRPSGHGSSESVL